MTTYIRKNRWNGLESASVLLFCAPLLTFRPADRAHHSLSGIKCKVRGAGMTRKNKGIFSMMLLIDRPRL